MAAITTIDNNEHNLAGLRMPRAYEVPDIRLRGIQQGMIHEHGA